MTHATPRSLFLTVSSVWIQLGQAA